MKNLTTAMIKHTQALLVNLLLISKNFIEQSQDLDKKAMVKDNLTAIKYLTARFKLVCTPSTDYDSLISLSETKDTSAIRLELEVLYRTLTIVCIVTLAYTVYAFLQPVYDWKAGRKVRKQRERKYQAIKEQRRLLTLARQKARGEQLLSEALSCSDTVELAKLVDRVYNNPEDYFAMVSIL